MPVEYHIKPDEGLVTVRVDGSVDLVDLMEGARALTSESTFDAALPHLVDLRGMTVELEPQAIEPFHKFLVNEFGGHGASIAVVLNDMLTPEETATVFRMALALGQVELFDDYEQALRWLMRKEFVDGAPIKACAGPGAGGS